MNPQTSERGFVGKTLAEVTTWVQTQLDFICAHITSFWQVEHNQDGSHTDVNVETLTIADDPEDGTFEGNITGSLIPTTATQDLGGEPVITGGTGRDRPWRNLRLSGTIQWANFSNTGTNTAQALTQTQFTSPNNASFTFSMVSGVNTHTFTIGTGLSGLTTNRAITCTALNASSVVTGLYLVVTDGVTAPGATTGQAKIYVDTADGDLKVVFADGTVKTIVTDT
jgi:hypothetical protein